MAAYATAAELLERHDARNVGDLVSDLDVRIGPPELLTDNRVSTALTRASGAVEAALLAGARYSAADLAGLTGNAAEWLKGLVCDLAFVYLARRRGDLFADKVAALQEDTAAELDALRSGKHVLPIAANIEAGLPSTGGPSLVSLQKLNLLRDRTRNYFPARALPDNR